MAITRTPIIDDDGSGTTGTVLDNAWKQELYNQIDALTGGIFLYNIWTPIDVSGAGLVFTGVNCQYAKIGRVMAVFATFQYPTTSNGQLATVGGLPFANAGPPGGFYQSRITTVQFYFDFNQTAFNLMNPATGGYRTNAEVSGTVLNFSGLYLAA